MNFYRPGMRDALVCVGIAYTSRKAFRTANIKHQTTSIWQCRTHNMSESSTPHTTHTFRHRFAYSQLAFFPVMYYFFFFVFLLLCDLTRISLLILSPLHLSKCSIFSCYVSIYTCINIHSIRLIFILGSLRYTRSVSYRRHALTPLAVWMI